MLHSSHGMESPSYSSTGVSTRALKFWSRLLARFFRGIVKCSRREPTASKRIRAVTRESDLESKSWAISIL